MKDLETRAVAERALAHYRVRDIHALRELLGRRDPSDIFRLITRSESSACPALDLLVLARGIEHCSIPVKNAVMSKLFEVPDSPRAKATVDQLIGLQAGHPDAWEIALYLGYLFDRAGAPFETVWWWNVALHAAQAAGECLDEPTTPACFVPLVVEAVSRLKTGKHLLLSGIVSRHEAEAMAPKGSLRRVHEAVDVYLKRKPPRYTSEHQRPRFFFVPDLPTQAWFDRGLFPQFEPLESGFEAIRADAREVVRESVGLEDFVPVRPGMSPHLSGASPRPTWEAFFFYRHGRKVAANHERCQATSDVLERLDLCRIDAHAPEICFSVLRAGTRILPHFGVTNARSVIHLPLEVPADCGIRVTGSGERTWTEGRILSFDDTFEHEAWNDSPVDRIILLMDCWNPHLTLLERSAVADIVTTIARWHAPQASR